MDANRSEPPTMTEIDHVAIAVRDLDAAIAWYESAFGTQVAHRERIEHDGVEEALLKVAESFIQLLSPITDSSPVARFLERKGEGIHHVGYRVADCAAALEKMRAAGVQLIRRRNLGPARRLASSPVPRRNRLPGSRRGGCPRLCARGTTTGELSVIGLRSWMNDSATFSNASSTPSCSIRSR